MAKHEWHEIWLTEALTIDGQRREVKVGLLKIDGPLDGQIVLQVSNDTPVVLPYPTHLQAAVRKALNGQGERGW